MQNGFIKLHRKILDWQWYGDADVFRYFVHCLLKANYKDKMWKGQLIKRGSFATSRAKLAQELGLNQSKIRRIERKLIGQEIDTQTTNKFIVITLVNYEEYNSLVEDSANKPTIERQTIDKQSTTTKNIKKEKNIKNLKTKGDFREFMTEEQLSNSEFLEKWEEWVNYRRIEKRNSLTNTSAKKQLKVLANAADPISCIDNSLLNGYTGIFDKKDNRKTDGKELAQVIDNF